jgi:hypothetical protein
MAFATKDAFRSLLNNEDFNNVRNDGCAYLSKAEWPILAILILSTNKIGS